MEENELKHECLKLMETALAFNRVCWPLSLAPGRPSTPLQKDVDAFFV